MEVFFIGVGPGDPDLITIKGKRLIECADTVIYPGSSINAEILEFSSGKEINSWNLTDDEVVAYIIEEVNRGKTVVRLHSGDPSLFENISMHVRALMSHGIEVKIIPGVSSLSALAVASKTELTANQTLIVTRSAGEPWKDGYRFESGSIKELSEHHTTMAIFIGTKYIREIMAIVDYPPDTPVAVVYHASWDDEQVITGTVADIADKVEKSGVKRGAAILITPCD